MELFRREQKIWKFVKSMGRVLRAYFGCNIVAFYKQLIIRLIMEISGNNIAVADSTQHIHKVVHAGVM
jgi:hypothetical protein